MSEGFNGDEGRRLLVRHVSEETRKAVRTSILTPIARPSTC